MSYIQSSKGDFSAVAVLNFEARRRETCFITGIFLRQSTYRNGNQRKIIYSSVLVVLLMVLNFSGFAQNAKKVISLAPSITENIYLIGAQNRLVGCTSYCTQAIEDNIEQVGSTIDVNIEKIFALQPDLVLTMMMTKNQDIEAMRKLGIKVVVILTPVSFNEICEQTLEIAKLVGGNENARQIIQETKLQVDSLKQLSSGKTNKIFFQIGANPVFTVLEKTFMNDFITFCNGVNIANGMRRGTITRESVLIENPDVIIIATMGGFGNEEMNVWKGYSGIKAVENKKVFLIDSETACVPTPDNFLKAFTDVTKFVNQ